MFNKENLANLKDEKIGKNEPLPNDKVEYFRDYFNRLWGRERPLAKLFKTDSCYYIYDTGTNKVVKCRKAISDLIGKFYSTSIDAAVREFVSDYGELEFTQSAQEIKEAIEQEHILTTIKATNFFLAPHFKNFEEILNSALTNICLELTDNCNLRCNYCSQNAHYRSKSDYCINEMNLDIAYKSIEFLKKHSYESDSVSISFYGGEPLLQFPKIKACVEYAKDIIKGKDLSFSLTTNGTLVTPEIANFFRKNNFSVLVSFDGPRKYHNLYRKDKKGKGSYDRTEKGLRILVDSFGDEKKRMIGLNLVYTPPYSKKKIEEITKHFKKLSWLSGVGIRMTYPSPDSIPLMSVSEDDLSEDKPLLQWEFENFKNYFEKTESFAKSSIELKLAQLMQRPIFKKPIDKYFLNGCCLPGEKRIFVTTDGTFHICEKITSAVPAIGNIYDGFDFDVIKKFYIDEYASESLRYCSNCWAISHCNLCYVRAIDNNGKYDMTKKISSCKLNLLSLERLLGYSCKLMEENPQEIEYLYDIDIH